MKKYLFGLGAMLVGAGLMFVLMHGEVSAEGETDRCDSIEVPTISGKINLKIPKGIQSGQIVRIKGKGMPDPRRRVNGDQFVKINIITSDNKSNDFILLLEKMNKILGDKPNFTKIK